MFSKPVGLNIRSLEIRDVMALRITCYYCGAKKFAQTGTAVKLSCEQCSSSRILLDKQATFRCALCGKTFALPADQQVFSYHDDPDCRGYTLILLNYN